MATIKKNNRKYTQKRAVKYTLPLKKGYHRHHIVPIHAGGKEHPWNECYLLPNEHADAHYLMWITTGDTGDFLAYAALNGWKDFTSLLCAEAGKKAGVIRQQQILEGYKTSLTTVQGLASRIGKIGGMKGGPSALKKCLGKNPNHQSEAGKRGAAKQILVRASCDTCGFVCRPTNMWRHHKAHGHEGSTRIES